ncbi:YceI family protein [Rheinheimera sp.]|uniref:YceI family protein n=1 Tax=Rheinheimera sp. TaxID=1869214 RepID=UPI003AF9B3CB
MKKMVSVLACALSFSALADWSVDSQNSSLSFVSVKNELVAETHHFKQLQGSLSDAGELKVSIPVSGIETNIPLRNERILQYTLLSKDFAAITATAKVDMTKVSALKVGQVLTVQQPLDLTLLAQSQTLSTSLQVVKLSDKQLLVYTTAPVVLDLTKFKLDAGIEKLRELAGLKVISPLVPVSFSVSLTQ